MAQASNAASSAAARRTQYSVSGEIHVAPAQSALPVGSGTVPAGQVKLEHGARGSQQSYTPLPWAVAKVAIRTCVSGGHWKSPDEQVPFGVQP